MLAAAERISASAPILFVPRQVMLGAHSAAADKKKAAPPVSPALEEKKEKRRKKKRSETLEADSIVPLETLDSDIPNGGALICKENGRGILFSSIAAFLESNGFSKTLAAFRSEAQHEINGGKTSVLNLEDEFCKFLKTRTDAETSIDWKNELGSEKAVMHGNGHSENVLDATEHCHSKNRKSTGVDDGTKVESLETHTTELEECPKECISTDERVVNIQVDGLQVKSKGKKSKKLYSEDDSAQNTRILGDKNMKEMKTSGGRTDLEMVHTEESKVETKDEKKKKKLVSEPLGELPESCNVEGNHVAENIDCGNQLPKPNVSNKEKRKKKEKESKNSGKSRETVEEKSESNPEHKSEKKNKKKRTSESVSENVEHEMEASQEINDKKSNNLKGCESNTDFKLSESVAKDESIKNAVDNADSKSKDKKKNRGTPISSNLCALGSDQLNGRSSQDGKEGHTGHGKSDSGKEKALVSEEIVEISEKISKKRKKSSLQENTLRAKNDVTKNFDDAEYEGAEDNDVGKKRKMEKSDDNSTKTVETSPNEKLNMLIDCKETPSTCDSKETEQHQLMNGNTEKKKKEQDTASKVTKNEKRSAEPKTVNAFQRVKIDEVKFIDERLQDNSYWAKGGADSGYGAKAQEILGQVRGRDFRHEKTKKKRGSYRGGQIDLESHSIKFSYSDEE